MTHYVTLLKWTEQGIRNAKESPKRVDQVSGLLKSLGAKLNAFYYTMGEYDAVAITDAPNDEVAFQAALQIGGAGNVRTTTLKAWTVDEATKVFAKLP